MTKYPWHWAAGVRKAAAKAHPRATEIVDRILGVSAIQVVESLTMNGDLWKLWKRAYNEAKKLIIEEDIDGTGKPNPSLFRGIHELFSCNLREDMNYFRLTAEASGVRLKKQLVKPPAPPATDGSWSLF